jgi:hypothetical protein
MHQTELLKLGSNRIFALEQLQQLGVITPDIRDFWVFAFPLR